MLPSQREAVILSLLQHEPIVSIETIGLQRNCSPGTARRDLAVKRNIVSIDDGGSRGPARNNILWMFEAGKVYGIH